MEALILEEYSLDDALDYFKRNRPQINSKDKIFTLIADQKMQVSVQVTQAKLYSFDELRKEETTISNIPLEVERIFNPTIKSLSQKLWDNDYREEFVYVELVKYNDQVYFIGRDDFGGSQFLEDSLFFAKDNLYEYLIKTEPTSTTEQSVSESSNESISKNNNSPDFNSARIGQRTLGKFLCSAIEEYHSCKGFNETTHIGVLQEWLLENKESNSDIINIVSGHKIKINSEGFHIDNLMDFTYTTNLSNYELFDKPTVTRSFEKIKTKLYSN